MTVSFAGGWSSWSGRVGRSVAAVCAELGLAEATVYRWKAQALIDRGEKPGRASVERGELAAANRRIRELETELELVKKAAALFEEGVRPKDKYPVIAELAGLGFSAKLCCRLLQVAPSGFFMWRRRSPSPREIRMAWLTDLVLAVHADSRGTYGWRRVHAELIYGHGIIVNRKTVRKIMRAEQLHGLPGMKKADSHHHLDHPTERPSPPGRRRPIDAHRIRGDHHPNRHPGA
jgi:putative transposase